MSSLHASCVAWGEVGILLRGPAGSGKSSLARALVDAGGRLVGDDRVGVSAAHGRLVARGHPALAGLIELRGLGPVPAERRADAAVLRLVVDLADAAPRLPEAGTADLAGIALPRLVLAPGPQRVGTVLWRARTIRDTMMARC